MEYEISYEILYTFIVFYDESNFIGFNQLHLSYLEKTFNYFCFKKINCQISI